MEIINLLFKANLHSLKIRRIIQQGRPFPFVTKFVRFLFVLCEVLPTNQIAAINSSSLIGRYLEEQLDVNLTTVKIFAFSLFPKDFVKKRGYKGQPW